MIRNAALLALACLAVAACAKEPTETPGHDHSTHKHEATAPASAPDATAAKAYKTITPSKDYALTTCVISDDKLGGDMGPPIAIEYEGREIQFCCKDCIDEFLKDPKTALAKIDAAKK